MRVCVRVLRLYRSLEDYDVVRGIFGGKIGTKEITCTALEAEANNDFAEAVKLYNEVAPPSPVSPGPLCYQVDPCWWGTGYCERIMTCLVSDMMLSHLHPNP